MHQLVYLAAHYLPRAYVSAVAVSFVLGMAAGLVLAGAGYAARDYPRRPVVSRSALDHITMGEAILKQMAEHRQVQP